MQLKNSQNAWRKTDRTLKESVSRLKINGFVTAGVSRATVDKETGNYRWKYLTKITDEWNWKSDSVAGVQFTYNIDPKWDATVQILSRFDDEFSNDTNLGVEWAFLAYRPNDKLAARFGRVRTPLYMFSEYLDVGFAYPWVRPPVEMYRVPFTFYDGVSVDYLLELGSWNLLTNLGIGSSEPGVVLDLQAKNVGTLNFNLNRDAWTLRTNYTRTKMESDDPKISTVQQGLDLLHTNGYTNQRYEMIGKNNLAQYLSYGAMYDDGTWQVIGEVGEIHWKDSLVLDGWSNYLSVGRRFGNFLPYAVYAHEYTPAKNDKKRQAVSEAALAYGADNPALAGLMQKLSNQVLAFTETQKSVTLGVRWDVSSRVATKLEVSRVFGFDKKGNHIGRFDPIENNQTVDTEVNYPHTGLKPQYVTSLVVNAVF
ncbi:Hypothetical protein HDN1F_10370 [gamma proteobacterium HdN1]|nr:Hypothetical protein HDN1F_10370 [gamma proteobacterium HdN1]